MRICVYCGSSDGHDPSILEMASDFGRQLAQKNIGLVYGGSSLGVMGTLANAVMETAAMSQESFPAIFSAKKWLTPALQS